MAFSSSHFIGGDEEFARPHGRQALGVGWEGGGPARAEQAGFGDPGDGDGIGLVAAKDVEMRVVLTKGEADMAAWASFEDQDCAGDRLGVLAELEPVAGLSGRCLDHGEIAHVNRVVGRRCANHVKAR